MEPERVGFLLLPGFSLMALSASSEPLRAANRMSGKELYLWRLISPSGEAVSSSSGFDLMPHHSMSDAPPLDKLVVVASLAIDSYRDEAVFAWLRRVAGHGCSVGAVSTGSIILARAGLLDGYRATIHWELNADLLEEFPDLDTRRDLFVMDRDRFTCGGGVAGLDMMLALIGQKHGHDLAAAVAEQFLHSRIRQPTENQRMDTLARYGLSDSRLGTAIALMEDHLETPLPTEAIALRAGVSGRQLERLFATAFNATPAKFYLELRLKEARRLLTETGQSITTIALRCGFASVSHFSTCYREAFNDTPARSRTRPARQPSAAPLS